MGTAHYNFTYIENGNAIDIAGDTKTFLDEIDNTIYAMSYSTFADMVADAHSVGDVCVTNGYYAEGDGGDGFYKVSSAFAENYYGEQHGALIYSALVPHTIKLSQWGVLPENNDIADIMNSIIAKTYPVQRNNVLLNSTVFEFNNGRYYVSKPLDLIPAGSIVKGTNVPVPYQEMYNTHASYTRELTAGTALVYTGESGTCMRTDFRCRVEGIVFVSETSYTWTNAGYSEHPPTTSYEPIVETVNKHVNGLDMGTTFTGAVAANCSVTNCGFVGFGGFGLKPSHHALVSHCVFNRCHIGMIGSDAEMIDNCYFGNGGYGIVTDNIRASNCWFDSMAHHAIFSGTPIEGSRASRVSDESTNPLKGEIQGCVFDHIQYSAIRAASCGFQGLSIDSSFSRCGFYRAGLSVEAAIAELGAYTTREQVYQYVDGMCAINIPIANMLKVKGTLASAEFLDGSYDGRFPCPQFAINAVEFCNGELEFTEYNRSSESVNYVMKDNYWWTSEGLLNTLMPNLTLAYKYGTCNNGKVTYVTNMTKGSIKDPASNIELTIQNNTASVNSSVSNLGTGKYTLPALPGYNTAVVFIPLFTTTAGYVGDLYIPKGRNVAPVAHINNAVTGTQTILGSAPLVIDNLLPSL